MCLTMECTDRYIDKLADQIKEYMELPISARSNEAISSMTECWQRIKTIRDMLEDHHEEVLDSVIADEWKLSMENADGTYGPKWNEDETDTMRIEGIPSWQWNVAMNLMYSDYCKVAIKYGIDSLRFYADMAKAFLCDDDAVEDKLTQYYTHIVAHHKR